MRIEIDKYKNTVTLIVIPESDEDIELLACCNPKLPSRHNEPHEDTDRDVWLEIEI